MIISRKEAQEQGLIRYYTGKPCKYGHISERYVNGGGCVECLTLENLTKEKKEYLKEWYLKNKQYRMEYCKEWRLSNKDYKKEKDRQYYLENRENIIKTNNDNARKRYLESPDYKAYIACKNMLRRVLTATNNNKDSTTSHELGYTNIELRQSIEHKFLPGMSWDNYGEWHIDHIIPSMRYIKSGVYDPAIINSLSNLIPMWAEHNLEKSAKTLQEYLEIRPERCQYYYQFLNEGQV